MVESHAFIFAGTISLDARAARKYRWCLYIYVLSVNLRVPGPLTACTTDIGFVSVGGCKSSLQADIYDQEHRVQPANINIKSRKNIFISLFSLLYYIPTTHKRIIFHTKKPSLLIQNP